MSPTRYAATWTKELAAKRKPFYMQYDIYAPHGAAGRDPSCAAGPAPGPKDEQRFADTPLPRPPNFDEADVSDKPPEVSSRPRLDSTAVGQHHPPLPLHARLAGRRRSRDRQGLPQGQEGGRAQEHGLPVRLRQRLLLRRAPDPEGQERAV